MSVRLLNKLYLPLVLVISYLSVTLIIYEFGLIDYYTPDKTTFYLYLFFYMFSFAIGYMIVMGHARIHQESRTGNFLDFRRKPMRFGALTPIGTRSIPTLPMTWDSLVWALSCLLLAQPLVSHGSWQFFKKNIYAIMLIPVYFFMFVLFPANNQVLSFVASLSAFILAHYMMFKVYQKGRNRT